MPRMPASSHTTWPAQSACHHRQHLPPLPPPPPPGPHRTPLALSPDTESLVHQPANQGTISDPYMPLEERGGSDSRTPPLEVQGSHFCALHLKELYFIFTPRCSIPVSAAVEAMLPIHIFSAVQGVLSEVMAHFWELQVGKFQCI